MKFLSEWRVLGWSSYKSLHNNVDIKIGIIYKNHGFAEKGLKFRCFWSIVCVYSKRVFLCPVPCCLRFRSFGFTVEVFATMARFLYHDFQLDHRRIYWLPLAFFFQLGLICGGYLFLCTEDSFLSVTRLALGSRVTVVGLAGVLLLPFLLSAFAVSLRHIWLLYPVAFWKALCFSFVSLCILVAFGSGGWLALPLILFSDLLSFPALWLFWLRGLRGDGRLGVGSMVVWLGAVGCLDYCIISPFAASLL